MVVTHASKETTVARYNLMSSATLCRIRQINLGRQFNLRQFNTLPGGVRRIQPLLGICLGGVGCLRRQGNNLCIPYYPMTG